MVVVQFEGEFDVYCLDEVCYHWVEVRSGMDLSESGPRFCCKNRPSGVIRSSGIGVMILFRSNFNTDYGVVKRGFQMSFYSEPHDSSWVGFKTPPPWPIQPASMAVTTCLPPTQLAAANHQYHNQYHTTTQPIAPHQYYTSRSCSGLDIAFIIDSSGSIKKENWPKILNFVSSITQSLPIAPYLNRIAAVSFGSSAFFHFDLDDYNNVNHVVHAVQSIPWKDEMTNTSGGIRLAQNQNT